MRSSIKLPTLALILTIVSLAPSTLSASIKLRSPNTSFSSHPQARLNSGLAIGRTVDDIDSWRGIPYAQKPIGKLRLMPPVPDGGLTGEQTFDRNPDACFNVNTTVSSPDNLSESQREKLAHLLAEALSYPANQVAAANNNNSTATQSEVSRVRSLSLIARCGRLIPDFTPIGMDRQDCLYLNVHRPKDTQADSKLPVLVWIYGGGFTASDISEYRPEQLLKRSVELDQPIIFVSMNYRLGAYGFLSGPEVLTSSRANLGLRDQALAIDWVHENIESFGGDPSKVTIWGESAGSMSVGMHLIRAGNKSSEGKFSGSPYHIPNGSVFDVAYTQMANSTGCHESSDSFSCLQELPTSDFNTAMNSVVGDGRLAFAPAVDGDFIPDFPDKMLRNGDYHQDVSIINGCQSDEGTILALDSIAKVVNETGFDDYIRSSVPGLNDSNYEKIKELYPAHPSVGAPYGTGELYSITAQSKRISSVLGDFTFHYPRRLFLSQLSRTNPGVFSYIHDTFGDTPLLGSYHAIEMINTFGWMNNTPITLEMTARWINFVHTQSPDAVGYSRFPVYKGDEEGRQLLWFGNETSWIEKDDFRRDQTDYLEEIIAELD